MLSGFLGELHPALHNEGYLQCARVGVQVRVRVLGEGTRDEGAV